MKTKVFILLILFFSCLSCSSSHQVIMKTPHFRFINATLSKEIENDSPSEITNSFSTEDRWVIAHVRLENLSGTHSLKWNWYDPAGNLYYATPSQVLKASQGKYHKMANAWHKLNIKGEKASDLIGDWTLNIYLDGRIMESRNFRIEEDVDTPPAIAQKMDSRNWGLIIGIEEYENLAPVEYARNDADTVKKYFMRVLGIPEENIISLTDSKATKSQIEGYLRSYLPKNVEKDTTLYIYFVGHGTPNFDLHPKKPEAFLVPYDGDTRFIENSCYRLKTFYDDVYTLDIQRAYVFLDSCFCGTAARSEKMLLAEGVHPALIHVEDIKLPSDKVVSLTASEAGQVSNAYPEKKHGIFTYFLLSGLKGRADTDEDDWISVGELYHYVRDNVNRISRRKKGRDQIPVIRPDFQTIDNLENMKISRVFK